MGDLRTELLKIREKRGILTPRIVFEEAKPKSHPLHDRVFDMPQKEAAEQHYLANAAQLLRVTFRTDLDGKPADLRAFWRVDRGTPEKPAHEYVPIDEIAVDPVSREVMLREMMRAWKRFKNRYQNHTEFFELVRNDPDLFPVDPDELFGETGEAS